MTTITNIHINVVFVKWIHTSKLRKYDTMLQFPLLTLQIVATFCTSEYFRFLFHQFIGSFSV